MKCMRRLQGAVGSVLVVLVLAAAGIARAGEGTTEADFLRLPVGARSNALAGAYSALGNDAEAIFYNPAGIIELLNPQIYLSHLSWWEQVVFDSVWGVQPLGKQGSLGMAGSFLNVPSFNSTEDSAASESAWSSSLSVGYARRLSRPWVGGVAVRLLNSQLGTERSWGLSLDAGTQYYLWNDQMTLAATMKNIGLLSIFERSADTLPLQAGLGAAYQFWPDEPQRLAVAAEMQIPLRGRPKATFATEGWLWNLLAMRLGMNPTAEAGDWLNLGVGVRWQQFHLDYAVSPVGLFGPVHHVAAGYDFARQSRLARPQLRVKLTTKHIVNSEGETGYEADFMPWVQIPAGLETWEVTIADRAGNPIRRLAGRESMPLRILWDGHDAQGKKVDFENYYTFRIQVTDRLGCTAEARGEILPLSVTRLPQLKVLPRDIFEGKVSFVPKNNENVKEWIVSIVNAEGAVVKKYQGLGAVPKDFAWDGTDENNRPLGVQAGYSFLLQVKDEAGNEVQTVAPLVQVIAHSKLY